MPKIDKLGDIKIKGVIYQKKQLVGWKDEPENGRKYIYLKEIDLDKGIKTTRNNTNMGNI